MNKKFILGLLLGVFAGAILVILLFFVLVYLAA